MKIIFSCVVLLLALAAANSTAVAQRETANGVEVEKDLALLRRDIRAEKKKIIAANLPLTETEATKKTLTDAQASSMIKRWVEIQIGRDQLRQKYIPLFERVIPGKKVALFYQ